MQFHRMIHFRRLLEGYPYSREQLITEAITDVCPLLRGEIWAALLNVRVRATRRLHFVGVT